MKLTETSILLPQMHFFAHHGVLPQEQKVGSYFEVSLEIETDFRLATITDELDCTISYADIHETVKAEMAIPSHLLEHVAGRISRRLYQTYPAIKAIRLELYKQNPPMGADCTRAGIRVCSVRGVPKRLAIFDLDGTLLNTIADLAQSTNQALAACGFPTHPTEAYNFFVGNGINKLFERALPPSARTDEHVQRIRSHFLPYYDIHNTDLSTPYPGIPELLEQLQAKGVQLAVASNKYQRATEKLISHYFPHIHFVAVLGQRDDFPIKPDPQIVHEIIAQAGVLPEEVIYIGDSGVDMLTALRAGVESIGVLWGFRPQTELEEHSPTYLVEKAEEIADIIL